MSKHRTGRLAGRTALITGAAGGIGCAIAERFIAEGASVVMSDRSPTVTDAAARLGAVAGLVCDVSDEAAVAELVASATTSLGMIDTLVNSHGIVTESAVVDMPIERWHEMLNINLTSVFLLCRAVLPAMLTRGDGRIINVSSQLGIKGGERLAHYSAAKAGVIALTKSLAYEVSSRGVRVNAIAPGPVETPLIANLSERWKESKRKELPLGRFGTVDEVAPTAVLLAASPDGDLYVGQTLGPNSGDVM